MVFRNEVKNIQAAAYNGARTVFEQRKLRTIFETECFFNLEKIIGIQKYAGNVRKPYFSNQKDTKMKMKH